MKRNIKVFNYSFILRTIGLGMFNTLFNIYILENSNFSNAFLEKFLAIGNFSMAVSSYFIGFTIDRYNKKKLMLFFSSICAICIFGEVVISNEIVMYVVSVIYGIGAAGLITIVPPILMTYKTEENRNFIVYNRAINIISLTIGALLAGLLTGKQFSISIKNVLLIVPILYIVSIIVFTLHDNIASKSREKSKERNFYLKKLVSERYWILIIVAFLCLGFAPLLVNFINVYFYNRYNIDVSNIAYMYALINFCSGITIFFVSKMEFKSIKCIMSMVVLIILDNIILVVWNNLYIQVCCVFAYICLFELLTSYVYDIVLSKTNSNFHGCISGVIQASCNLSETLGIYIGGVMLGLKCYWLFFGVSIISTVVSIISIIILMKEKDD